jgi:hypothetical protein
MYYLGLSSTKIAYYAALGIPILSTNIPSLVTYRRLYRFGELIKKPEELGLRIEQIENNFSDYARQSRRFYREVLNPTKPLDQFCEALIANHLMEP